MQPMDQGAPYAYSESGQTQRRYSHHIPYLKSHDDVFNSHFIMEKIDAKLTFSNRLASFTCTTFNATDDHSTKRRQKQQER